MNGSALNETVYCDFSSENVRQMAVNIAESACSLQEIAESSFRFVRDNIRFTGDALSVKASETLTKGYGMCWNKALLLTALLRANGIPSKIGYSLVTRDFLKPVIGDNYKMLAEVECHYFTLTRLGDEWIAADPTLDRDAFDKYFAPMGATWNIEWNGKDSMQLYTEYIVEPMNLVQGIDLTATSKG